MALLCNICGGSSNAFEIRSNHRMVSFLVLTVNTKATCEMWICDHGYLVGKRGLLMVGKLLPLCDRRIMCKWWHYVLNRSTCRRIRKKANVRLCTGLLTLCPQDVSAQPERFGLEILNNDYGRYMNKLSIHL